MRLGPVALIRSAKVMSPSFASKAHGHQVNITNYAVAPAAQSKIFSGISIPKFDPGPGSHFCRQIVSWEA
jgi:hypothetical protein